ncbi:MAG: hypothetical protein J6B43_02940 [Lachnospiraceae bacterium]|nr:hypothetical protein [Lachnospiraceae bacterium]
MEFTGKVVGILQNFETGQLQITFTVNEPVIIRNGYDAIKDLEKLSIKAVKYREKRSLDANAYAWVLMSKIAALMNTSKEEVYEEMLRRYGVLYEDEDGYVTITVKAAVDMSKIEGHWQLIKDNGTYKGYAMIKGTSQYNTKEMSCFIDGVISECKDLGIETLPPEELKRIKEEWGRENLERAHR